MNMNEPYTVYAQPICLALLSAEGFPPQIFCHSQLFATAAAAAAAVAAVADVVVVVVCIKLLISFWFRPL